MHGQPGDVGRPDDDADGHRRAQLRPAGIEASPEQRGRQRRVDEPAAMTFTRVCASSTARLAMSAGSAAVMAEIKLIRAAPWWAAASVDTMRSETCRRTASKSMSATAEDAGPATADQDMVDRFRQLGEVPLQAAQIVGVEGGLDELPRGQWLPRGRLGRVPRPEVGRIGHARDHPTQKLDRVTPSRCSARR